MNKTIIFVLTVALTWVFILPINADEPRLSLTQLIEESAKRKRGTGGYPAPNFDAHDVRKEFFGDETAFRRAVAALLQTGESDWNAIILVMFLDIHDESISKILREKFAASDSFVKDYICNVLSRHRCKENLDFLVDKLKQPDLRAGLRSSIVYYLTYFQREYFEGFDAERKDDILNALLACLHDEREVRYRFGETMTVSDSCAVNIGYLGSFAKPALPIIKKKFASEQDDTDSGSVCRKIQLAWSIVCIVPEQCNDELEYILQKAVEDKRKNVRWEAICSLDSVPPSLAEKVIPCLCSVIQKEPSISNKVWAAEAMTTILKKQELRMGFEDKEDDDDDEDEDEEE